MPDNKKKDYNLGAPVEKHDTAAWVDLSIGIYSAPSKAWHNLAG